MTDRPMSQFAQDILNAKYAWTLPSGRKETWPEVARRVVGEVCGSLLPYKATRKIEDLVVQRKFLPGGRYLYAAGRPYHQIGNCFLFRIQDSKEGWADHSRKAALALMSGGGIGTDYSLVREESAPVKGLGGFCTGPTAPMQITNEQGRHTMQGGSRRSAIWASLNWKHPDIFKFITLKNWPKWLRDRKVVDFNTSAPMDMTNISVGIDGSFFSVLNGDSEFANPLRAGNPLIFKEDAEKIYWMTVERMCRTAEPGFSIDCGENEGETLRNACTEITSCDDSDICNLGSLVISRFEDPDEFEEAVSLATSFLVCGTIYGDVPFEEVRVVRNKTRRLGLGIMGFHEWLLKRGKKYGQDDELGRWLERYVRSTRYAHETEDYLSVSRSLKTRAIAPNGTIGIVAETTTSIEPIFAAGYLRRYLSGKEWKAQYVVDATAQRLVEEGVDPDMIEDAYTLAEDVERRVAFQSWVQTYVDHAISSTINLPPWGSSINNKDTVKSFGTMLLKYLPTLRGITCYPDGSRGGQPLTRVSYREAIKHLGKEVDAVSGVVEENRGECIGGVCGV